MKIIFRLRASGQTEVNTEEVMKNVPKLIYFTQIYACECPLINIFFFPIYMIGLGGLYQAIPFMKVVGRLCAGGQAVVKSERRF